MKDQRCSEELSALLDAELTGEERDQLIEKLRSSTQLRQKLAELRGTQTLYRMAFEPARPAPASAPRRLRYAAAVLLLVCLGVLLGIGMQAALFGDAAPNAFRLDAAQVEPVPGHTILHVSEGNDGALATALRQVEALLQERESKHADFRVELVVNGEALRLLRADVSPYGQQIQSLLARYDNLAFVACQQTLKRLSAKGEVPLVRGVTVADSALDRIVGRLREGWTYVRI